MQKNRLQVKKSQHTEGGATCYYVRASNGHTYPGLKCPGSLYSPVTDWKSEGAPPFFMHGTMWEYLPGILDVGLSCLGHDNPKNKDGRQFIHGCPYLPGDDRIHSGLRPDSEVILMISLSTLIRDGYKVWRSANDIVMTSGAQGRIPVDSIIQMIGVKHHPDCKYDRTGQIWGWPKHKPHVTSGDEVRGNSHWAAISQWKYEVANDATTLMATENNKGWFRLENPFNLKLPATQVQHEMVLMINELSAGQPASGSDGSWIHATCMTDMSGFASNGEDG